MLVKVLNFGTNWWARFGRNAEDPYRFSQHAAYYNSTGVRCGNKVRPALDYSQRLLKTQHIERLESVSWQGAPVYSITQKMD